MRSFRAVPLLLLCVQSLARAQSEPSILPVEVVVTNEPQLTRAGGSWFLVYELHLTNFYSAPVTIGEVTVLATGKPERALRRYSGKLLERNLKVIGPASDSIPRNVILPGRRAVLFVWAGVPAVTGSPPAILHRVTATIEAAKDSQIIRGGRSNVQRGRPVVIDPPLRGAGWLSYYGACPDSVPAHDQLAYPRDGLIRFPQRFAVDWVRFGPDGRVFHGAATSNENYYAYRQPIYAVADGTVKLVIRDVEENTPPKVTVRMTRHTVAGNVIVLDIGAGRYAVYGHIRPGSIRVSVGDRVNRGQILAEVGNSGNSTGPHLHFHVIDAPSPAAGEGVPFMYGAYELISAEPIAEEVLDEGRVWRPPPWKRSRREMDLPTCGSVVGL